jgi:hypothetical protein
MQKTRKIEKVTASQDDDFVGGLNTTGSICRKHEKIEKVTGSQDDDFVGVSKASGRGHLPSFIHPTRKLVVIEIAAVPPGLSLEKESSPTLYGQVTSWERMLSRRNTEFSLNLVVLPVLIEALVI